MSKIEAVPISYNLDGYLHSIVVGAIVYFVNTHSEDLKTLYEGFNPKEENLHNLIDNFLYATNRNLIGGNNYKKHTLQSKLVKEFFDLLNKIKNDFEDETKSKGLALRYNNGNGNNLNDIIITKNTVSHLININTVEGGTPVYAPAKTIYKEHVEESKDYMEKGEYINYYDRCHFEDEESKAVGDLLNGCVIDYGIRKFNCAW